jgi:uncharacterized protein
MLAIREYIAICKQLLTPAYMCESLDDIALLELYYAGYRTFFLDVDNTLATYEENRVSLQRAQWVQTARSHGFEVYLLSNNSSFRRINMIATQLNVNGLFFACKPFPYSVTEFAHDRGIALDKSVIVGDKILTDIVLGNWVRAYSILVEPLDKKQSFFRALQRDFVLQFLKILNQF